MVIESLATKAETKSEDPMIKTDHYVAIMSKQCKQDAKAVGAINDTDRKLSGQILYQVVDHLSPRPPWGASKSKENMASQLKVSIAF